MLFWTFQPGYVEVVGLEDLLLKLLDAMALPPAVWRGGHAELGLVAHVQKPPQLFRARKRTPRTAGPLDRAEIRQPEPKQDVEQAAAVPRRVAVVEHLGRG